MIKQRTLKNIIRATGVELQSMVGMLTRHAEPLGVAGVGIPLSR